MSIQASNSKFLDTNQAPGLLSIFSSNPKRLKRIRFLAELFENGGHEIRIAGGAVRDIISGKEPHDIDLASTAKPDEALDLLKPHEDVVRIIVTDAGRKHGTVAVKFKEVELDFKRIKLSHVANNHASDKAVQDSDERAIDKPEYDADSPYEITTLRCDKITDGRHAEVVFINDWKLDAERRDLTINAMFLTLDDGRLIDYFGGESDLRNGIVRFVGDAEKRMQEDYLRILRFFRFWSRYGRENKPDADTMKTLGDNLDGLEIISGERIWQELKKIFTYLPCVQVTELMMELKVFNRVGICSKTGEQYESYIRSVIKDISVIQDNLHKFKQTINSLEPQTVNRDRKFIELLPIILISTAIATSDDCFNASKRLKFSNLERDTMLFIVENRTKTWTIDDLKRQLALTKAPDRFIVRNKIRAFMIYAGLFDELDEFTTWECPEFPQMGLAVAQEAKRLKLKSTVIKEIVEGLRQEWAISEYRHTKDDLEKVMHELIAQHLSRQEENH